MNDGISLMCMTVRNVKWNIP